jgi:CheY-like chemotaxis protein
VFLASGPRRAKLSAVEEGSRKPASGTRVRPGRVLVVEDRGLVGAELAEVLLDHEVVAVGCGEDALELLASGKTFDLILSDVLMPGMNGIAFLGSLVERFPSQAERLVFMVDRMVSPVVSHLLSGVSSLCLERPFDVEGLRGLVERRIRAPARSAQSQSG